MRAMLRDGVALPIAWLSSRSGLVSRTTDSTLRLKFVRATEPQIHETRLCGSSPASFGATVELTTSDGSLSAALEGSFVWDDGVWNGSFTADLASVTGSVDLGLETAWSEVEGQGAREGELRVAFTQSDAGVRGVVSAVVGYPVWPDGTQTDPPTYPRVLAPIEGYFPPTRCSVYGGEPVAPDEALPEAAGKSPRMVLAEARSVLSRCPTSWPAWYRDDTQVQAELQLTEAPDPAFCIGGVGADRWLSWAIAGTLRSHDERLSARLSRGSVSLAEAPIEKVALDIALAAKRPMQGWALCSAPPDSSDEPGTWDSYLARLNDERGRACLSSDEPMERCALE